MVFLKHFNRQLIYYHIIIRARIIETKRRLVGILQTFKQRPVSLVFAVFLQSVFMKSQTVSLRFQTTALNQIVHLLTSQTWLIKVYHRIGVRFNIVVQTQHKSALGVRIWAFDCSIFFFCKIVRERERVGKRLLPRLQ